MFGGWAIPSLMAEKSATVTPSRPRIFGLSHVAVRATDYEKSVASSEEPASLISLEVLGSGGASDESNPGP